METYISMGMLSGAAGKPGYMCTASPRMESYCHILVLLQQPGLQCRNGYLNLRTEEWGGGGFWEEVLKQSGTGFLQRPQHPARNHQTRHHRRQEEVGQETKGGTSSGCQWDPAPPEYHSFGDSGQRYRLLHL